MEGEDNFGYQEKLFASEYIKFTSAKKTLQQWQGQHVSI